MAQIESLQAEKKFKKTEVGEIPVEWEVASLGDVSYINMGQSPPSETCFDYKNGLPFFQGKAEFGEKYPRVVTWCCSPKKIAEKGDILISVRAPVGDINIAPEKCCIGRGLAAIRGRKAENDFLYFILEFVKGALVKIGQGSTFEAINKDVLFDLKISLPTIPEQKKIAEILSSVDQAIEKSEEIIEKTKQFKKGLMQELLTGKRLVKVGNRKDEGGKDKDEIGRMKEEGKTKFKKTEIGEIPVEWEVTKIKDVGRIITGGTPPTKNMEYYNGEYLWATPADLGMNKYIRSTKKMLSREGMDVSRIIPKDAILVVCIGSTIGKIGIAAQDMAANQQINSVICNNYWDPQFVYYWLLKSSNSLVSMAGRQAVPIVNKTNFSLLTIAKPPQIEQQKIGLILASIDSEIEQETAEKEKLEQLKKGLMQVLLTGKVRVKI